jgi:hypothetical protein
MFYQVCQECSIAIGKFQRVDIAATEIDRFGRFLRIVNDLDAVNDPFSV